MHDFSKERRLCAALSRWQLCILPPRSIAASGGSERLRVCSATIRQSPALMLAALPACRRNPAQPQVVAASLVLPVPQWQRQL